ncbi:BTB/POZ domain-containing protein 1 [Achaetomium macrosporum]|uniref:BTB/POZ domain-containing protein 1 n=1 Tax=Achaetomium macrosporum TaxID=79813 RepID=A0AAN7CCG7_9PEZI|nr:BTB/POZ domain-containing protein 1 [Achaetomium macrosporum]
MTHLLWKYYWEDDVDKFRRLLQPAGHGAQSGGRGSNLIPGTGGSPGYSTSPRNTTKSRKIPGFGTGSGNVRHGQTGLGRNEVNSRDHVGLTVLLRAASSTAENAIAFVGALLEHPAIDIYVQDPESGWNALHRALYAGNISIARLLLEKERKDLTGHTASLHRVGQLIKTKDHEGKSPFDLYHSTIGERSLKDLIERGKSDDESDSDEAQPSLDNALSTRVANTAGEDLYAFGSNRNLSLGFGDEDDRQFPERVCLKRPDSLLRLFHREYPQWTGEDGPASQDLAKIPALVLNRPLIILDVVLSKFHSAVLTADPVSNLYVCGVGRGGRLGLGDENTRFTYTPVQGPFADRRVVQVALGQNHSMAIDDTGALWTWGNNAQYQLGYALPEPAKKDEDPISTVPRQVFGPLKKEVIVGIAASSIHSVAHTGTSLYCWGKNIGQLALMDADSRSLEFQQTPRKVAASLFSSPIVMVTAIDKATTILLQNHTVCVFTAYGYHIVKFPFATFDMVGNIKVSTRYEPGWNQIHHITSGGETIAALTRRGDLFTMNLDHKVETNPSTTSTTNPSKIKGAVTQPQCIWSARQDGVRSVGVGEHGSVIISTQSGAVWRRIKRAKAKDASSWTSESKRKDYKFQRVPCISKVATVRASAFGAFAAIRKDSDVMKEQLRIGDQSLWEDVAPLNCLHDFTASEPADQKDEVRKFWGNDSLRDRLGPVAYEVLKSSDIEVDLAHHLTSWSYRNDPLDAAVCTSSSPDIKIPVHGWLLAARSPVLRSTLAQCRKAGSFANETFSIVKDDGKTVICFQGLDLVSLLNLVLFAYEDKVIPVWNFTGQIRSLAYRYRQIRQEVMKLATRLNMNGLEAASRLQVEPKRCMDRDFQRAIKDPRFFADGDALLELDGAEVAVHSALVCQRCPWFQGLYQGRSAGMWLESRRAVSADRITIDLKHADPKAFQYVLQYLYGDCGAELFDPATCDSFQDFLDLVMEVMSIANYLMLDRLSQICQHVMGRFANIRNIAQLLNAISPCSVTEFKDAGLEYICLQLETMLENHLLDELDEELLLELDEVVRDNQLAQSPFVRSGRAELILHENNPWLAEDVDEERQIRIKEIAFKAQREEEKKLSSVKTKYGSLDDANPLTPTPDRVRKVSNGHLKELSSPSLRPKASQGDLVFDMDEDESLSATSPSVRPRKSAEGTAELDQIPPFPSSWKSTGKKIRIDLQPSPAASPLGTPQAQTIAADARGPDVTISMSTKPAQPWGAAPLPASKLDLRDIIQAEVENRSALSTGLAVERAKAAIPKATPPKMSQKEKKRQQQAAQAAQAALLGVKANLPKNAWERSANETQPSPWKTVFTKGKTPLKGVPSADPNPAKGLLATEATIPISRRTASPDTRFSGQRTPSSSSAVPATRPNPPAAAKPNNGSGSGSVSVPRATSLSTYTDSQQPNTTKSPLVPHSKVYIPPAPKAEPLLGLSMQDIMGQQTRDKQQVKEAVAKRSLQEIQQEQAFQEWWDAESRRMQEEERRRMERAAREKEDSR